MLIAGHQSLRTRLKIMGSQVLCVYPLLGKGKVEGQNKRTFLDPFVRFCFPSPVSGSFSGLIP